MSYEYDRNIIRVAVDIFIRAAKAGKLGLLFEIILQGIKAKFTWDMMIERLNGEFYGKQVKVAVDKFKQDHPEQFEMKTDKSFGQWLKNNPSCRK